MARPFPLVLRSQMAITMGDIKFYFLLPAGSGDTSGVDSMGMGPPGIGKR